MTDQHRPTPATSQESPITVVGLGQCGSNVTLALSLAIDPLVIVNPGLSGPSHREPRIDAHRSVGIAQALVRQ